MDIDNIPIILHTCDKYEQYWNYWWHFTKKYCKHNNIIFATENISPSFSKHVKVIKTGSGQWGERLINILSNIDLEYIFYMQEDFWPIKEFPYTQKIIDRFLKDDLDCWRICENSVFYNLTNVEENIYKYNQNSLYTLSHQFSLWKKSFLSQYLLPNETPWENETYGSNRMNNNSHHKIYFQEHQWYVASVSKGLINQAGRKLLVSENI